MNFIFEYILIKYFMHKYFIRMLFKEQMHLMPFHISFYCCVPHK